MDRRDLCSYGILRSEECQFLNSVVKVLCNKSEGRCFDSGWSSFEFFIDIILPIALWPWGLDSASNRNKYQEYFLTEKAAGT
jgi:hypothetical protein